MTADVLGSEPAPWSRRALLGAAAALLLLVVLVLADRWQAGREGDRLAAAAAAAEDVVAASSGARDALREHQAALATVLAAPPPPSPEAYRVLVEDAALWLPRLVAPRRGVAEVRVLPWHRDLRAARSASLRRLDLWAQTLALTADDPRGSLRRAPEVTASRDRAAAALARARR